MQRLITISKSDVVMNNWSSKIISWFEILIVYLYSRYLFTILSWSIEIQSTLHFYLVVYFIVVILHIIFT